jgi:hypothetical protein
VRQLSDSDWVNREDDSFQRRAGITEKGNVAIKNFCFKT